MFKFKLLMLGVTGAVRTNLKLVSNFFGLNVHRYTMAVKISSHRLSGQAGHEATVPPIHPQGILFDFIMLINLA
jgi:hypothetical protein